MLQTVIELVTYLLTNYGAIIAAVNAVLVALIALFMFIPGDQPEKTLKAIVEFIEKFSKKPQA